MPSTDPEDVNVVCLRVAYDLYNSFLGQCAAGDIVICTAASGGENMLALEPLPAERIVWLADKAGIRNLLQSKDKDGQPSPLSAEPVAGKKAEKAPPQIPGVRQTSTLTMNFQYVPVWSVPNNAITTYICEPKSIHTTTTPHKLLSIEQLSPRERIEVELACLQDGVLQLATHAQHGERFLLGLKCRSKCLVAVRAHGIPFDLPALSSDNRQYLDFTFTGVPPGVAHTRLNNLVTR